MKSLYRSVVVIKRCFENKYSGFNKIRRSFDYTHEKCASSFLDESKYTRSFNVIDTVV